MFVDPAPLDAAIVATFAQRVTFIPSVVPLGLTIAFSGDDQKGKQWTTYAESISLEVVSLARVVDAI